MLMQEEVKKVNLTKDHENNNEIEKVDNDSENDLRTKAEFKDLSEEEKDKFLMVLKEWDQRGITVPEDNKEESEEAKIEKHKKEIENIKLEGIRNRELKKIKHDEFLADKEFEGEIFEADQKAKATIPNKAPSILWGIIYILIGLFGTFASTVISIVSGAEYYEGGDNAKIAFLSSIFLIQGSVFTLYLQKTKILTMYKNYAFMFHIITKSLLTVSIYFNFIFFVGNDFSKFWVVYVIFFLTCIMIDGISVYNTSLGMDYLTRRVQLRNQIKSLPEMLLYNLFAKLRYRQLGKYNENILVQNQIVKLKGKGNYKAIINREDDFAAEENFIESEKKDTKNDEIQVEVVEEEPVEETTNQPIVEKEDSEEEDVGFEKSTKNEKLNYLKYIIKYRKSSGLIPSNNKVLAAYKDKKTINLNKGKINTIREELYSKNVLERPTYGGKNGSSPTYFTDEFLEKIEDFDGKTLPQISEKYENLDREKTNNLSKKVEEKVDEIPVENNENSEEKIDEISKENNENLEEKIDKKRVS